MSQERLKILYLLPMPPSPPRFGAQARMHGLMTELARRHDLVAIALVEEGFDRDECERAMREYCRDVLVLPNPSGRSGRAKRVLQLRSLASRHSFEHLHYAVPGLQAALDRTLARERFDVVNLEFPYLAHFRVRQSPPGEPAPVVVLDTHEIAYDLAHQMARSGSSIFRRVYGAVNWRKLRREESAAFAAADGLCACSEADRARLLAHVPSGRVVVIPNAADVEFYRPRPSDPPADDRTVLFFGLLSTFPNVDGLRFFVHEVWPLVVAARPDARLRIVGARAPAEVQELTGPGVELVGFVPDLRPELAAAATVVVPLRVGGGTRLKIVEAMAMGKAIVSTTPGAEGIDAVPGRHIEIADDPVSFAAGVIKTLGNRAWAGELGSAARELAVARYAWSKAARDLEHFYAEILSARESGGGERSTSSRAGVGARSSSR